MEFGHLFDPMWALAQAEQASRILRMEQPGAFTTDLYLLEKDCYLCLNRGGSNREAQNMHIEYDARDWCIFRVRLRAELVETFADYDRKSSNADCSFLNFGRGLKYSMDVSAPAQLVSLSLVFKTEWLLNQFGSDATETLAPLLAAGEAQEAASHLVAISVNAAIYQIARELLDLPAGDPFCILLAQAKSKELLFRALQALTSDSESPGSRFREQDLTQLYAVKQRLETDYANALTLGELSRWAGLNRRKLTEGFKALYGATVNEYLLLQRMTQAGSLLRQGLPVAQVAEQVGYLDRGSFSKVFKRHFGLTPKEY